MTVTPFTARSAPAPNTAAPAPSGRMPTVPHASSAGVVPAAVTTWTVAGALQVAAAAVLWGAGAAVAALVFAVSSLSPVALTFWRFALAAAVLLALHTLRRLFRGGPGLRRLLRERGLALAVTGVLLAAAQSLMYASVASMGAGLGTTLVLATSPIVMAVLSVPMLGLTLNRAGWLTMLPAIAAITALLLVSGADARITLVGPVLAVAAATSHALMTLVSKKQATGTTAGLGESDLLGRTALTFTAAALALLPLASVQGLAPETARPGYVMGLIVLLAIAVTVVPYLLYFDGVARIAPATAGVLMMCQLAAANIAGAVLLGETISPASGLLLAALAGAIVLHVALSRSRPRTRAAAALSPATSPAPRTPDRPAAAVRTAPARRGTAASHP